jgi:hypothetical protein
MVFKMHLAKVIIAVIAMPARKGVTYYTLSYGFIVVIALSLLYGRGFLLPRLRLHKS